MTNEEMRAGRFLRWHKARKLYGVIVKHLESGRRVQVTTYTRSTVYRSVEQFRCGKTGVYVARGKSWDCIDGCHVRVV